MPKLYAKSYTPIALPPLQLPPPKQFISTYGDKATVGKVLFLIILILSAIELVAA
jgi:hypothetical protein